MREYSACKAFNIIKMNRITTKVTVTEVKIR